MSKNVSVNCWFTYLLYVRIVILWITKRRVYQHDLKVRRSASYTNDHQQSDSCVVKRLVITRFAISLPVSYRRRQPTAFTYRYYGDANCAAESTVARVDMEIRNDH